MFIPLLTPEQSADWDSRAERAGISLATLMDAAGRAAAQVIAARFPERLAAGVLVAAGNGNNGGDGWVLARALHRAEVPVFVAPQPGDPSPLNRAAAALARAEGVREVAPDGPWPGVGLLVDALLGTGARGALRDPLRQLVERLNDAALPIVALDGPTGVDLLTGTTQGPAVQARCSITFGGLRRGHVLARDECGDTIVVDIGLPPADAAWPWLATEAHAAEAQGRFAAGEHKGSRGRVVVVGGDAGMTGALRLAARAAFGAGAGLVHAVAPAETVAVLAAAEPDLQTLAHDPEQPPTPALRALLGGADVVVIGPGLGRGTGRRAYVAAVMGHSARLVVDADALNAFQGALPELARAAVGRAVVLTPHPGEFGRLFPDYADAVELDPWRAAARAAEATGCTVLLKGVPTVIAAPGRPVATVVAGNPGLATGGSGDLLSGLIAPALAQLDHPATAAMVGALALGSAAEVAARRTSARALRPMDVVAALPDLWRSWETLRRMPPVPRPPVLCELEAAQRW